MLIQYIYCYPPFWRPFLHSQPEDAPCHGDRDPLTWLLTLREEHRLRVFENRVLRRIFEPKRDKVTEEVEKTT
jgi:hypothetical protein